MKVFEDLASGGKSYQAFSAPEDILVDRSLDGEERRRLLDAWRFELELSGDVDDAPRQPKDLLRRVNACRRLLAESEE